MFIINKKSLSPTQNEREQEKFSTQATYSLSFPKSTGWKEKQN